MVLQYNATRETENEKKNVSKNITQILHSPWIVHHKPITKIVMQFSLEVLIHWSHYISMKFICTMKTINPHTEIHYRGFNVIANGKRKVNGHNFKLWMLKVVFDANKSELSHHQTRMKCSLLIGKMLAFIVWKCI